MRFIDFFAGIGGFRLGMEMAGHECVGHCEIDNFADKSYRAMHIPKESEWFAKDITTVEYGDLPKAECYCFGFPCQSFSVAGSRGGFSDTRGTLFFEVMRIAKERKPEYLFAENVAGLLSHDGGRTFGTILATLGELGYWWEYQVLNSKNFGVPQNRERVFIIGHLGGRGGREIFPLGENDKKINTEYKQPKQIAIKQINHLDDWQGSTRQIDRVYSPKGLCPTLDAMGGGNREPKIIDIYNKKECPDGLCGTLTANGNTSSTHCGTFGIIQRPHEFNQGGIKSEAPSLTKSSYENNNLVIPVLTPDREHKRQNGRRFKTDGEDMFTLTAQDRHGVATGEQGDLRIRKLTPKECFRLQGFPDEYFERAARVNSNSQLYKQAGNSVTVNVIYEIAKRLKESDG